MIMVMTVVTEMGHMVWRVFQHVANACDRGSGCIQRKQDGKKKNQAGAHGVNSISNRVVVIRPCIWIICRVAAGKYFDNEAIITS